MELLERYSFCEILLQPCGVERGLFFNNNLTYAFIALKCLLVLKEEGLAGVT